MKIAIAHLKSISPYSQSRSHETPKLERETAEAHEARTWRERGHYTADGHMFIPPMAFKAPLDMAAKMLGMQIPGRGRKTYGTFFRAGVLCVDPVVLPDTRESVRGERVHCHANGQRGSGKRVWRVFPTIDKWEADVTFNVLADELTEPVFREHLAQAGSFVGIGRFRPENGGYFGRFVVETLEWAEM